MLDTETTFPLTIRIFVMSSADLTVLLAFTAVSNPEPPPDLCCLFDLKHEFRFLPENRIGKNKSEGLDESIR